MAVNEVREIKNVVLFVEYDILYDQEIGDEYVSMETEEIARALKRAYFINDDNEEIEITKKLTNEMKDMILYMDNQNTKNA